MNNLISMTSNHFADFYSGSGIAQKFAGWAAEYDVTAPYVLSPFGAFTSKSIAIQGNLLAFNEEQQFSIIKELCEERLQTRSSDTQAEKILQLLYNKYGELYLDYQIDRNIISETKLLLSPYDRAMDEYEKALKLYDTGNYDRHALDSIRLSLELFLKEVLNNSKSLENQPFATEILPILANKGLPKEINNLIFSIFQGLIKYQNENVKHDTSYTDLEVDFIIEQTSILMKLIAKSLN